MKYINESSYPISMKDGTDARGMDVYMCILTSPEKTQLMNYDGLVRSDRRQKWKESSEYNVTYVYELVTN